MALKNMVDREIRETELEDFRTIVNKIDELKNTIDNLNI